MTKLAETIPVRVVRGKSIKNAVGNKFMKIKKGNLDNLIKGKFSKYRRWVVGNFMPKSTMLDSKKCEVKWVGRHKGNRKSSEKRLASSIRTLVILISGGLKIYFPTKKETVVLSKQADYLVYDGMRHETEALEDSHFIVIRWQNEKGEKYKKCCGK